MGIIDKWKSHYKLDRNCCDGIYNSFDVHFTSACDNNCKHCVDLKYEGLGIKKPDVNRITDTIINNQAGYDDVLFLGGEPCLYLEDLNKAIDILQKHTKLKLYVTTSVPYVCYQKRELFFKIIDKIDGINLSVQHYKEEISDKIRCTDSRYDRQKFYIGLPNKNKIRINLNVVKPYLHNKTDIINCLKHYDNMSFNSIKLSEIQHGKEYFCRVEKILNLKLKSPYSHGCQTYIHKSLGFKTPILLKRSCFFCEETLKATCLDAFKVASKLISNKANKYAVIYEDGTKSLGWR